MSFARRPCEEKRAGRRVRARERVQVFGRLFGRPLEPGIAPWRVVRCVTTPAPTLSTPAARPGKRIHKNRTPRRKREQE
ncbi:hypothetical protein J6590_021132 [Homalodisca vitripennis]|nr:hypothetical protein J6590_021132 [Homalodisca vitripennis]